MQKCPSRKYLVVATALLPFILPAKGVILERSNEKSESDLEPSTS